ncbi:MAG: hypothetical protein R3F21_09355 [Myxococcota bacterium]
MTIRRFWLVMGMSIAMLGAASASAQVLVGAQQRFFEKWGDGSTGPDSVPCCFVTPMNATPTVDNRTIGQNMGAYFAEYKNKTAMVGNLFGFGTPAALNGDGPQWYGIYQPGTGGVTIKAGRYSTDTSLMLQFPGGNLRRLTTNISRTVQDLVMRPNQGPGNFHYSASGNTPGIPTFRSPGTWVGPYPSMAGELDVVAGPNRFGGTRAILSDSFATGVDNGAVPGFGNRFFLPVALGPGVPITAMNVVRRETRSATFAQVTIPSTMATTGMVVFQGLGTGWFTILPYTTGTVMAIASTIGTPIMDYTHRTDMGFNNLNVTGMGGITGQLQLVSGHLLQSRGGINTNLAGTNMTIVTFTPEPASAALLGAGALGLAALILHDRRRGLR